jgi:hypothetical protein
MTIGEIARVITEETGKRCSYQQVYNVLAYSREMKNEEEAAKAAKARFDPRDT